MNEASASAPPLSFPSPSSLPIHKTRRHLPHWTYEGLIYWITFRLADSLPQDKLRLWRDERQLWLRHNPEPWNDQQWREYNARFGDRLDAWLDAGYGSRALARPDVRAVVSGCLLRYEGSRLRLHAAVIMPTHVHLLMQPLGDNKLPELMKGIKGASARQANLLLGRQGQFWLDESFDHIVRSEPQYWHFVRYIAENPVKAGLDQHEYWLHLQCDAGIPACDPGPEPQNPPGRPDAPEEPADQGQTGMSATLC